MKEVLNFQKVLNKYIKNIAVNLYSKIIKNRDKNLDYEISWKSLDDNLLLLALLKKLRMLYNLLLKSSK